MEETGFDLSSILDPEQAASVLFPEGDGEETSEGGTQEEEQGNENEEDNNEHIAETAEDLFPEESESVGDEGQDKSAGDNASVEKGKSPQTNNRFYSSVATALRDDGVFPDLSDDDLKNISSAEDLKALVENQINAGLDARQKRIYDVMTGNGNVDEAKELEGNLAYLDKLTDDQLTDEGNQGENLRRQLIYLDFINRGYSKERAEKEVKKSLDAGTDIDDARDALQSNKEFYQQRYNSLIETAKQNKAQAAEREKQTLDNTRKAFEEDNDYMEGLKVTKDIKKKMMDNFTKPSFRDPETGVQMSAMQKMQKENPTKFWKNVAAIYAMTDGFKSLDGLVAGKMKKEMKRGLSNLESMLSTPSQTGGRLELMSGEKTDTFDDFNDGYLGKGMRLRI